MPRHIKHSARSRQFTNIKPIKNLQQIYCWWSRGHLSRFIHHLRYFKLRKSSIFNDTSDCKQKIILAVVSFPIFWTRFILNSRSSRVEQRISACELWKFECKANRNPRSLKYGKIKLYTSQTFICKTTKSPFRLCVEKRRFNEKDDNR